MEQAIIKLLEILIGVGITASMPFLIKALSAIEKKAIQQFGEKNTALIEEYAAQVVAAIAQRYGTLENEQKFAKAISLLEAKFGVNFLTEDELEVLIESALAQFKISQGQIVASSQPSTTVATTTLGN